MSILGIVCSLSVTAAVAVSPALDMQRQHTVMPPAQEPPSHALIGPSLIRSIGIFALSMAGHAALPSIRNSMGKPHRFHFVISAAFGVMLGFNLIVSCAGYWYWGDQVSEIVMQDIALRSPLHGLLGISTLMTAMIGLNAFSKVPVILLVLEDMILSMMYPLKEHPAPPRLGFLVKMGIMVFVGLLTVTAYDVLGIAMSLLGGLTSINASVVFPALFYLRLFWEDISHCR
mmetsp:Transcript_30222/g.85368  ORF Transcript_30222/g.85368 Transcript_30222/m.85368 type:complete len:230 (-) Transcript_30222:1366-2055(-)